MRHLLFRLAACLWIAGATASAQQLLEFEMRSSGTTVVPKDAVAKVKNGAAKGPEKFSARVRVSLRPDSIATLNLDTGEETLLDRKREELVIFDHGNRRVRVAYVFGWIAALDQEKANRIRISEVMGKANLEDPSLTTFWIESLFQSGSDAADEVKATERDGRREFTHGKEVVVAVTPGEVAIPAALRPMWRLLLIRTLGVHPSIRAQLAALDKLPQRIWRRSLNVGRVTETEFEFHAWPPQGGEAPAVAAVDLAKARSNYAAWVDPKDGLDVLLADIAAKRIEAATISQEQYEAKVKQLVKDKQDRTALLMLLEARFAYPDIPVQELIATIDMRGEQVRPVLSILRLGTSDPDAAERELRAMPREGLEGVATLEILQANALTELQKTEEAQAVFLGVLRRRPWLAAVWKDLGDLYVRQYRMPEAWRCWEVALELSPDHPIVRPLVDFRRFLRERYGDWLGVRSD